MSIDRTDIDALVATVASAGSEIDAGRSIIPRPATRGIRPRIEAMLADAARVSLGSSLGAGGRGVVNAAEQLGLRREVAVKRVRGEVTDEALVELLQEAMITGALEHPNIVPVHYIGVGEDGEPFIVLKKIEGVAWDQLIAQRDLEANLRVLLDVINAVRFAHSRRIIHRDLKPANVMVGEFGEVYVLDWGLAVSLDDDHEWLPRAGDVRGIAGTLAYMAPEMLAGEALSERTDVYLLGAILCEIATGRPPHRGSVIDKLVESVMRSRPPLDGVPSELSAIIRRAMAADPADRFASAGELQQAIERFLVHREAARLAEGAAVRLSALLEAIDSGTDRDALYNLFGECRFGFREAIRRWPENQPAADGLERAVTAMVAVELERGEAAAARRLVAELEPAPPDLVRRVDAAVARERERLESLRRLEADLDPVVAGGSRVVGALAIAVVALVALMVAPTLSPHRSGPSWGSILAIMLTTGVALAILFVLMRRPLFASRPNRLFGFAVVVAWIATIAAMGGQWHAGREPLSFPPLHPIIWFSCFSMLVPAIDRRLWPASVVFLIAIIVLPSLPLWAIRPVLGASLLFMVAVVGWVTMRRRREEQR